jgi:hypothetical protein
MNTKGRVSNCRSGKAGMLAAPCPGESGLWQGHDYSDESPQRNFALTFRPEKQAGSGKFFFQICRFVVSRNCQLAFGGWSTGNRNVSRDMGPVLLWGQIQAPTQFSLS